MIHSEPVRGVRLLFERRFGELGRAAADRLQLWLTGKIPYAFPDLLARHLDPPQVDLLFDSFWQVLPFGTGGRRGRVGYGANRLNHTTLAMTVQGHCQFLREAFPVRADLAVVVANDVRVFMDIAGVYQFLGDRHPLLGTSSRSLAKLACEIYAGNGVVAYLVEPGSDEAVLTTPELSFLIHRLGAVGGINLSASHNPPDDNGVKVYDAFGSQPIAPDDQRLVDAMDEATDIRRLPFADALGQKLIRAIPDGLHREYVEAYVRVYGQVFRPRSDVAVVYTPLCGCGLSTVGDVLRRFGFPLQVPPRQGPDGTFAEIPFKAPNPEVPEATTPARQFADKIGSSIVLSSDPDADRVGLEAKLADGTWYHFDGNQIAAILCYFLMLDPEGPRRKGLVIETLVTTKLLGRMVAASPGSAIVEDLLVGFKYVADVLKTLEREGRYRDLAFSPKDLVLAAEESHGVIVVPEIRDKDATPACMYLAALHQRLQGEGQTLFDYYLRILEEFGGYDSVNRSITLRGSEGMLRKDRILASLRQSPPSTLGGRPVHRVVDFWDEAVLGPFVSETDRLPRNVIQYHVDGAIVTVRPSGTEPKLKFYCQLLPTGTPLGTDGLRVFREARAVAGQLARQIYKELLGRIELSLGEVGLCLPDLVDFDGKQHFERATTPEMLDKVAAGAFPNLQAMLDWLRQQTASMTAGADPLPALKQALATFIAAHPAELAVHPLLADLDRWAKG